MAKNETGWASVPAGKLEAAKGKLFNAFGNQGAEIITLLDDDPAFLKRMVDFAKRRGFQPSESQRVAGYIMGKNFFGPADWVMEPYSFVFTRKQLVQAAKFPWGEDVLTSVCTIKGCGQLVRDCHFAFWGGPRVKKVTLSINALQGLHPASGQPRFYSYGSDSWYNSQKFANEVVCQERWYLLHREIVPNSTSTDYQSQLAMLPPEYEAPMAVDETVKDLLHRRQLGVYPNLKVYARCQDLTSSGRRVGVGGCGGGSSVLVYYWIDSANDYVGLGASRKLP